MYILRIVQGVHRSLNPIAWNTSSAQSFEHSQVNLYPSAGGGPILVQHSPNVGKPGICTIEAGFCCLNTGNPVNPEVSVLYFKHLGWDRTMTS